MFKPCCVDAKALAMLANTRDSTANTLSLAGPATSTIWEVKRIEVAETVKQNRSLEIASFTPVQGSRGGNVSRSPASYQPKTSPLGAASVQAWWLIDLRRRPDVLRKRLACLWGRRTTMQLASVSDRAKSLLAGNWPDETLQHWGISTKNRPLKIALFSTGQWQINDQMRSCRHCDEKT